MIRWGSSLLAPTSSLGSGSPSLCVWGCAAAAMTWGGAGVPPSPLAPLLSAVVANSSLTGGTPLRESRRHLTSFIRNGASPPAKEEAEESEEESGDVEEVRVRRPWHDALPLASSQGVLPNNKREVHGLLNLDQTTRSVLMIAPEYVMWNAETAKTNLFMHQTALTPDSLIQKCVSEWSGLVSKLEEVGVDVRKYSSTKEHNTPDGHFPNNWFSTHIDRESRHSELVLYPMNAPSRRREVRDDILADLTPLYHNVVDLRASTPVGQYLEGTGSLVLDRVERLAFAVLSERTSLPLAEEWCKIMGYKLVAFHAEDGKRNPVYHTNVVMSIGSEFAIVCLESIRDKKERAKVFEALDRHRTVVPITLAQMYSFAGNVLEVQGADHCRVLALSSVALRSFTEAQVSTLHTHVDVVVEADVSTIETVCGGGVRCMIAELF